MTLAGVLARVASSTETSKRPRDQIAHVRHEGFTAGSYVPGRPKSVAPVEKNDNGDAGARPVAIPARERVASLDTGALTQRGGPGDRHNSTDEQSREVTSTREQRADVYRCLPSRRTELSGPGRWSSARSGSGGYYRGAGGGFKASICFHWTAGGAS